jgi:hypothetical protein
MSYFLQKVRLAEKYELLTDRKPLSGFDSSTLNYEGTLEVVAAMDSFIQEAPQFYFSRMQTMPTCLHLHIHITF